MTPTRTGVIATKLGMSRVFGEGGRHIPVTVLKLDQVRVVGHRTEERDGYTAMQIGSGIAKTKRVSKANRTAFGKRNVEPPKKVAEFRVPDDALVDRDARRGRSNGNAARTAEATGSGDDDAGRRVGEAGGAGG